MENKYYLYRHIRLDKNEVFYIGRGKKAKKFSNTIFSEYGRAYNTLQRNKYWKNIFKKTDIKVEILYESNCINHINNKEIEFIKLYGRKDLKKGTLVNLTDGGDGHCGMSDKNRKIVSDTLKNRNRGYAYKNIFILDLNLKIVYEAKNAKDASKYLFSTPKYHKKVTLNANNGWKINKKFFVIKKEDWNRKFDILKINRKKGLPSFGNCKSFYYKNVYYKSKQQFQKALNLNRYRFDIYF